MAFSHEISEHSLKEVGRTYVHTIANCGETFDQVSWNHDITEPQRREQCFAEGPDIDNAGVAVQALQGSDRHARIAVFAVVIVFDDPGPGTVRPIEKLQTAPGAHGRAKRKLMRRSNERCLRPATAFYSDVDLQTLFVHWHRN